jgi:hypothetical protein
MINKTSRINFNSIWLSHPALNMTLVISIGTTGNVIDSLDALPTLSWVNNENPTSDQKEILLNKSKGENKKP